MFVHFVLLAGWPRQACGSSSSVWLCCAILQWLACYDVHGAVHVVTTWKPVSSHHVSDLKKKLNLATDALSLITLITIFSCLGLGCGVKNFLKSGAPYHHQAAWHLQRGSVTHDGRSTLQCQVAQTPDESFMEGHDTILTLTFTVFFNGQSDLLL